VPPPLLLVALALLCREFFHIFFLLWEFAWRQALLQCLCTKQGTSMLKHQHWSELPPYSKNFWVTRPLPSGLTLSSVVCCPFWHWIPCSRWNWARVKVMYISRDRDLCILFWKQCTLHIIQCFKWDWFYLGTTGRITRLSCLFQKLQEQVVGYTVHVFPAKRKGTLECICTQLH